jgi:hypothetical protein
MGQTDTPATHTLGDDEQRTTRARDAHRLATHELISALVVQVIAETLAVYPNAATLVTNCYRGDDLGVDCNWHMHAERVLDTDRNVIAGWGELDGDVGESWAAYTCDVVDYLHEIIALEPAYGSGEAEREIQIMRQPAIEEQGDARPKLVIVDGQALCPECDSTEFQYEEDYPTWRRMDENANGTLVFDGDFEWGDGDDDPGVVCANWSCRAELDSSNVEVEWQ